MQHSQEAALGTKAAKAHVPTIIRAACLGLLPLMAASSYLKQQSHCTLAGDFMRFGDWPTTPWIGSHPGA